MKAADKALDALQNMRKGLSGTSKEKRKRIKSELTKTFPCKKARKSAWKHRFVCLSKKDQQKIPTQISRKMTYWKQDLEKNVLNSTHLRWMESSLGNRYILGFLNYVKVVGFKCVGVFLTADS